MVRHGVGSGVGRKLAADKAVAKRCDMSRKKRGPKKSPFISEMDIGHDIWRAVVHTVVNMDAKNADAGLRGLKEDPEKLAAIATIILDRK